jgi:hypothetical protein
MNKKNKNKKNKNPHPLLLYLESVFLLSFIFLFQGSLPSSLVSHYRLPPGACEKMKSSWTSPAFLALTLFVTLALGTNLAFSYKIYALSNTLDVFSKGNWTNATPPFTRYYSGLSSKIAPDRTGSALHALTGSGCNFSCPVAVTILKFNTTVAGGPVLASGAGWRSRFAFDKANNIYSSGKFDPTGPLRSPIGRYPSAASSNEDEIIGWIANNLKDNDITSFRGGNAMVFAGTFDTIYKTSNASNPDGTRASNVALYDTRK